MRKQIKIATISSDYCQSQYRERHNLYGAIAYYRLVKPYAVLGKDFEVTFYNKELAIINRGKEQDKFWDEFTKKYDIIVTKAVDNAQAGAYITYYCQKNGTKLVIDLDDNYFDIDPDNPAGNDYQLGSQKRCVFSAYLSLSDAIICSTPNLQKYYKEHIKKVYKQDKPVYLLPNLNDINDWKEVKQGKERIIGWAGSITHDKDLKMVVPALNRILNEYPDVKFEIIGGLQPQTVAEIFSSFDTLDRVIVSDGTKAWNAKKGDKTYPDLISERKWTIGLAPLMNTTFNRGRSNIKWLEFSMNKIPLVCSATEPYMSIPDELTLKAIDGLDFYKKIKYLLDNPKEAKEIGEKSYEYIKNNLQWSSDKLENIMKEIYELPIQRHN